MTAFLRSLRSSAAAIRRIVAIGAAAPERARRRRAARALRATAAADVERAEALRSTGFSPWLLSPELRGRLLRAYRELVASVDRAHESGERRSTGKAFFSELLTPNILARDPIYVDVALERGVLATVSAAMELVPQLESIEIYRSLPTAGAFEASQLWHRDVNDKLIVKLFVYLNDVAEANGPFTFIPAPASKRVARGVSHYMPDSHIDRHLARDEWRRIKGPAGSAFLIDTGRCLHHGSRCIEPRVAYIATYSSGIKFTAMAATWSSLLGTRAAELDALQRAVCGIR